MSNSDHAPDPTRYEVAPVPPIDLAARVFLAADRLGDKASPELVKLADILADAINQSAPIQLEEIEEQVAEAMAQAVEFASDGDVNSEVS